MPSSTSLVADLSLQSVIKGVQTSIINPLVPLLVGIAVCVFFWGLISYLQASWGDVKKLDESKKLMVWGVITLFVIVCIWGFTGLLSQMFFGTTAITTLPTVPKF